MKKHWVLLPVFMLAAAGIVLGQGFETFNNCNATATYLDGFFTGDDGFIWYYYHSRNEGDYPIDGKGLMLRRASDSRLESDPIPGGIGSFNMDMRKAFTGNEPRQLELYINGNLVATSIIFGNDPPGADDTIYTFPVEDINIEGDFIMMIKNVGSTTTNRQATIDNITWTAYPAGGPTNTPAPPTATPAPTFTPTPLPTIPCEEEMLFNSGLEDWTLNGPGGPPDFWELGGTGISVEQTSDFVFEGTYAGLVTKLFGGTQHFRQHSTYGVQPGAEYKVSYWVIDNDGVPLNQSRAWINFYDGEGVFIAGFQIFTPWSLDQPGWQYLEAIGTAPPNAVSAQVRVAVYGDVGVVYYVDAISLIEVCESTPTPGPTQTPTPTPTGVPTVPCEEEMLWNGDLEDWTINGSGGPPDFWTIYQDSGVTAEQTTDEVHGGDYAALITKTLTGTRRIAQIVPYAITPGNEYTLSYWIIDNDGNPSNQSRAWIAWYPEPAGQGTWISNSYTGYSADQPGWQNLTVTDTAPANAVSADIRVSFYGEIGVTYYVDTISLVEVCPPTPTPGTPTATPVPPPIPATGPAGIGLLLLTIGLLIGLAGIRRK